MIELTPPNPARAAQPAELVLGPPAARRERLLQAWRGNPAHPSRQSIWIARTPAASESVRRQIGVSTLGGSVLTLGQAAERVTRAAGAAQLPLGAASQRALLAELTETAERRGALGPLQPLLGAPGLIDHLIARFGALRLDGVGPDAAAPALRRRDGDRAGGVIANLYRDYVRTLRSERLADEAARIELATHQIAEEDLRFELVVIDLPPGLAAVEQAFVRRLAEAAERLVIGVACPGSGGADVPAGQAELDAWRERLGGRGGQVTTTDGDAPNGLRQVRERTFAETTTREAAAEGVRVLAGGNRQDVARRVARQLKAMIRGGVRPETIVLAAPRPHDSAPRYAASLGECGVPVAVEVAPRLSSAPLTSAILDLLTLAESDGAFEAMLRLLTRHDLPALRGADRPEGFATANAACEWLVRELQVPSGLAYVRGQAERLAAARAQTERMGRLTNAANAAVGVLQTLEAAVEGLPEQATPLDWLDAIDTALVRLGHPGVHGSIDSADRAAADAFEEALASIENLALWRGRTVRKSRLADALDLMRSLAGRLRLPSRMPTEGRVRLVGAHTAIGLDCEHLVVVDADESSFAGADADRSMLDFYELSVTPTRSVTYAYAALDDAAQPLVPSPYVADVERLFAPGATRAEESISDPRSPRESREGAVLAIAKGDSKPLATLGNKALLAGLRAVDQRARGDHYGAWEGLLAGGEARGWLGERYGPDHLWSASQLELMATCPYKFYARQVLRMAPLGELALGVDYRRRGSLMHDALAECLTAINAELGPGQSLRGIDQAELAERLAQRIETLADLGKLPAHEAGLLAIEARQATDWAARYAQQQRDFEAHKRWSALDRSLTPTLLEARFGPKTADDGAEDDASIDRPFEFTLPSGERLRLTGRIDRIDTAAVGDQTVFTVVDYKTGRDYKSSREQMESGKQLQPVLYALAAQDLFFGGEAVPVAAGYWAVQRRGFVAPRDNELPVFSVDDGRVEPSDAWRALTQAVAERCESLVHDVRAGAFPMHNDDEHCGRTCEFSTVCRVAQARSLGKTPAEGLDA